MDKVERKRLIKSLLSGRLSKKQRKAFADLESVDIEILKSATIIQYTIKGRFMSR